MKTHTTDLLRPVNTKFALGKSSKSKSGFRLRNDDNYKSYMAGLNKQIRKNMSEGQQAMALIFRDTHDIDAKIKMALDAPQRRWYENDRQVKTLLVLVHPTRIRNDDLMCRDNPEGLGQELLKTYVEFGNG